jgi:hypothetical protein
MDEIGFHQYTVETCSAENYALWKAGVRRLGMWVSSGIAKEVMPQPEIRKHKFLWFKWNSSNMNRVGWFNQCIIRCLEEQKNRKIICRILEHGAYEEYGLVRYIMCVWENGRQLEYRLV